MVRDFTMSDTKERVVDQLQQLQSIVSRLVAQQSQPPVGTVEYKHGIVSQSYGDVHFHISCSRFVFYSLVILFVGLLATTLVN